MKPGTAVAWLVFGGAVAFSVQGGEYSTSDMFQLRREQADEQRQVAELERLVDSLDRAATAIERDPVVQERVARESFGMIRRGELLYRLVPEEPVNPDTVAP